MVEASGMEHVQQDNTALGFSGDSFIFYAYLYL
jgi:hypothetical protein